MGFYIVYKANCYNRKTTGLTGYYGLLSIPLWMTTRCSRCSSSKWFFIILIFPVEDLYIEQQHLQQRNHFKGRRLKRNSGITVYAAAKNTGADVAAQNRFFINLFSHVRILYIELPHLPQRIDKHRGQKWRSKIGFL